MNKKNVEKILNESTSDHLKNNPELIFLEYYAIKKDSININIDKESNFVNTKLSVSSLVGV